MRKTAFVLAVLLAACSRAPASPPASNSADSAIAAPDPPRPVARTAEKAFGDSCVEDAECAARVCFHKRAKGADAGRERPDAGNEAVEHDGYCSMHCREDSDCPVPLTRGKCGARGMCKRPE
jgi:hypothetical protein